MAVRRGCLLVADISGYSNYVATVELEHSHDILADLLTTVVSQLGDPLQLAKLEGDAVFCYSLEAEESNGSDLVPVVESCYFAFQRRLRNIAHLTTCDCNACVAVPRLSLKFVIHYGEFVLHQVVGRAELMGTDVIVVHRMLKNSVKQKSGLGGYALYTRQCVEKLSIDWELRNMSPHTERYDDVGEVEAFVQDLEARWKEEMRERTFYVGPGEAGLEVWADLPASAEALWQVATSPHKRPAWQPDVVRIEPLGGSEGVGMGAINHCVHGSYTVQEEIIDWRPYDYYSLRWVGPEGPLVGTFEFVPLSKESTRVTIRMDPESRAEGREEFARATEELKVPFEKSLDAMGRLARAPVP